MPCSANRIHKCISNASLALKAVLIAVLALVASGASIAFCGQGKFVPPAGKILVFAGQNDDSFDDYVKTTGIVPAGFMIYTSVQEAGGLLESSDYGAGLSHGKYLLDKYPNTAIQIGLYMVDALDGVANGQYDDNIDKIGSFIKESKRPVYLRIGYEFDGPHNHYDPAKYVAAYRHIADRLKNKGVNNIAYVWHSYASFPRVNYMNWYPGDEYVDWFGISFFAQHESEMIPLVTLAKQHNKPVMMAESTPSGIGTTSSAGVSERWFLRYFDFTAKYDIKAICYINCNWDDMPMFRDFKWGDCRLASNSKIKKMWKTEMKSDKYIQSSGQLFGLVGFESGK
jgi:Glycosyl hydrolase family 26